MESTSRFVKNFFSFSWVRPAFATAFSKLTAKCTIAGLALGAFALYKLLSRSRPSGAPTTTQGDGATVEHVGKSRDLYSKQRKQRDFTLEELKTFTGHPTSGSKSRSSSEEEGATIAEATESEEYIEEPARAYISVKGRIYDTYSHPTGKGIYGPGGAYNLFAGKDVTYNLAKMSFADEDMNKPPSQWKALTPQELSILKDWIARFDSKYKCVGFLSLDDPQEDAVLREMHKDERRAAGLPS